MTTILWTDALQVDNGTRVETAALYNLTDNTYVPFHITESPLCSGHVLLQDGTAFVVGGAYLRTCNPLRNLKQKKIGNY